MQAIIFALISYFGWGIGDIFGTVATRKIGGYSTTFWYLVLQAIFVVPLSFLFFDQLRNITLAIFILNVVLGVMGTAGLIAFYEGLRIGNSALVGTIAGAFAALVVVFSVIFLNEKISLIQLILIILIFTGILMSTLDFKDLKNKAVWGNRGTVFALIAMLLWGIYWTFIKIPIQTMGWFWPGMISILTFPIVLLFMRIKRIGLEHPNKKGALRSLVMNALLLGIGAWSFNFAIEQGLTSIVAPIAGSYPTLFVVLAFLFFKDPITRQQILGIITTLVGIVLLSIFSV